MFMKFKSAAFRQGLADGFSSPFLLFGGQRTFEIRENDVVEESWREVGEAIRSSMPAGEPHGKTTTATKTSRYKERTAA